jgi:hypothetical protein
LLLDRTDLSLLLPLPLLPLHHPHRLHHHHLPQLRLYRLLLRQTEETTHSENLAKLLLLQPFLQLVVDSTHSSSPRLLLLATPRLFDLALPLLRLLRLLLLLRFSLLPPSSVLLLPPPPTMNGNVSRRKRMIRMLILPMTIMPIPDPNVLDSLVLYSETSLVQLDNRLLHPRPHLFQRLHQPLLLNWAEELLPLVEG